MNKLFHARLNKPAWYFDPVTNGQQKVLKFFRIPIMPMFNKGIASGLIGRLFSDQRKRERWEKYVYLTGDDIHDTPELKPYDEETLDSTIVPEDWRPKSKPGISSERKNRLQGIISDLLKDGSPFDDPVPDVVFRGKAFCFTGKFSSATRQECHATVAALGAIAHDSLTGSTDYLVIGSDANAAWAHSNYGRKIEKAMILRLEQGKPVILSEADWL